MSRGLGIYKKHNLPKNFSLETFEKYALQGYSHRDVCIKLDINTFTFTCYVKKNYPDLRRMLLENGIKKQNDGWLKGIASMNRWK